ncbi:MAG TPA: ABC transporter permease [Thermoanaerobaculia bacterium]|nr:ABC transporter permease [Thermoanaerobaculia bacterium]
MPFGELFAVALQALRRNKLRSFLTLLGVIIGVATVVSVVSIISGLNSYVRDKVLNLNPDVLVFTKYGIVRSRNEFILQRKRRPVTLKEARWIERECRSCAAVGAQVNHTDSVHVGRRRDPDVRIEGYTANMPSMMRMDLDAGRFFNPVEEEHATAVAVIGAEVKDQLFPDVSPIGRTIYVRGYPLRVIGLSVRKGDILGQNQDNVIATPITFVQKILTASDEVGIYARPRAGLAGIDATQDEVRTILRALRKTPYRSEDPFGSLGAEAFQTLWKSLTAGAFALMVLISGISLVVGAIVIANIMFVSVVERTREIGVRRALGARRRDIRRQFLLEAALLSCAGGIAGVLLGAAIAFLVNQIFPAQVQPGFAVLGIGVAVATGVLAGLAPSAAASRVTPIEALRFE